MDVNYKVHSFVEDDVPVTAHIEGVGDVQAKAPGIVVELVEDGGENTITLRKVTGDPDAMRALFAVDATIVVSFTAAAPTV